MQYIERSAEKSKRHFIAIGVSSFFVLLIMLISFTHAFREIFQMNAFALLPGIVLTAIFSAIYWLNIISLEPHTLPYKKEKGSVNASLGIRIFVISIFAVFVAKLFESWAFGWLVNNNIHKGNEMDRIKALSSTQPWVWLVTLFIIALFLFPIRKKFELRRHEEYFNLKRINEKQLVLFEYRKFILEYNNIFSRLDDQLQATGYNKVRYKVGPYKDPPFNTIRINSNPPSSHEDFLNDIP